MPDGEDLRAAALAALAAEAAAQGIELAHPATEDLLAYQEGRLTAAEEEAVCEHLVLCPSCARIVLELAGELPSEIPETDEILSDRETARFEAMLRQCAGLPPSRRFRTRRWLHRAAVALAAAVLAVGLAATFWGERWRTMGASVPGPTANVAVHDLLPLDPNSVERDTGHIVDLPPSAPAVVLVLNLPDLRAFSHYRAELSEQHRSEVLWSSDTLVRNRLGSFTIEIPAKSLPPGSYCIELWGLDGSQREKLAEYQVDLRPSG